MRCTAPTGLELPDVHIVFTDDETACQGYMALFEHTSPGRITICTELELLALVHELAHAWVEAHLDDDDRDHYTEVRGYDNWNDQTAAWEDRATEDAAFVIQQNLMITRTVPRDDTWLYRAEGYEMLTGQPVAPELRVRVGGLRPVEPTSAERTQLGGRGTCRRPAPTGSPLAWPADAGTAGSPRRRPARRP